MATKSITITNEAYDRLVSFKGSNESFSDVVNKLTKRNNLRKLVGLISKEEADLLKKRIADLRSKTDRSLRKRTKEIFN